MAVCHFAYKSETLVHPRCISSCSTTLSETLAQWRSRKTVCTPLGHVGNDPLSSSCILQTRSVCCWEISLTHTVTTWLITLILNPRRPNVELGELAAVLLPCINIFIQWRYFFYQLSLLCGFPRKLRDVEKINVD